MRQAKGSARFAPASARALSEPAGAGWPFAASEFMEVYFLILLARSGVKIQRLAFIAPTQEADTEAKRRTHGPHGSQRSAPRGHPGGATRGRAAPGGAQAAFLSWGRSCSPRGTDRSI
jgi:hypothetical protein